MSSDTGSNVSFTGPTFFGGVFGEGVGGAVRKAIDEAMKQYK